MLLNIRALSLKIYILRLWHFFLAWCLSNQEHFSVAVRNYKIHVFDEAFLLLSECQGVDTPQGASTYKFALHISGVALKS